METFNRSAFKASLALSLEGISPSDISLNVSAASVRVDATIRTASASSFDSTLSTLTVLASSAATLSDALDVTVLEVVVSSEEVSDAESALMNEEAQPSFWRQSAIMTIASSVVCVAALSFVVCVYLFARRPSTSSAKRTERHPTLRRPVLPTGESAAESAGITSTSIKGPMDVAECEPQANALAGIESEADLEVALAEASLLAKLRRARIEAAEQRVRAGLKDCHGMAIDYL